MGRKTFRTVPQRRRRERRTDYKKRLKLVSSGKPRLVLRRSLKHFTAQIVDYAAAGDIVRVSAHSKQLAGFGWKGTAGNVPAAYLTGYLLGLRSLQNGIQEAVADISYYKSTKGNRLYAALKGCRDAGMQVNCDESILPDDERVQGKHIENYAAKLKEEDPELYKQRFSAYENAGADPASLSQMFATVKEQIAADTQ